MKFPAPNEFERVFSEPLWVEAGRVLLERHKIGFEQLRRADRGENVVILADDRFLVKIYTPNKRGFDREREALRFAEGKTSFSIPRIVAEGRVEGFNYLITNQLTGRTLLRPDWLKLKRKTQVELVTRLAMQIKELHSHDADDIEFDWDRFIENQATTVLERQRKEGGNPEWFESLPKYLEGQMPLLPRSQHPVFMHGDIHFGNIKVGSDRHGPCVTGIFDFADSLKGFHEYEFVAIGVLMIQGQGELQREFFKAYGYKDSEITKELRQRLMLLTILYEHSSLRRYAERLGAGSERLTLAELEAAIWNF